MGWKRAALAALLMVLVSCEGRREGAALSETTAPAVTDAPSDPMAVTRRVRLPVRGDFAVAPAAPDTELTTVSAPRFSVGDGRVGLFAVERPRAPGRCIAEVRLRLFADTWSKLAEEELAVYPSLAFDAHRKGDGDLYGYSGSLLDVRPRSVYSGVAAGWVEWDVTKIVKLWAGGGAFPSRGVYAPGRGPVVLALRDADLAEPFATATVASSESDHAPEAFAFVEEGCPARGRA